VSIIPQEFHCKLNSFIANISHRHIVSAGRLLGLLAYTLDTRHRRIVRRNLTFVYPEWSRVRVLKLSRSIFENAGVTILEICQMTCFTKEDISEKIHVRGKEYLLEAMQNPGGLIMVSALLGNWEMITMCISLYLQKPVVAIARKIYPQVLDRWFHRQRTRFGTEIFDKKKALSRMARVLRQGNALGLLIDQGTKRSEGIDVTFFGRNVTATPAAALLARRYGSSVLPVFCVREASTGLTVVVEPSLILKKTTDSRADLKTNTQIMTDAIEKAVRKYPDQWFWFHKRWKRHYPHLYPEDLARRQRRRKDNKKYLGKT